MKLVVIESPYAASETRSVDQHVAYARACMRDCLQRGEAPIASHLLYTQPGVLDDLIPAERTQGIQAGLAWAARAELTVAYVDFGYSPGMTMAVTRSLADGRPVEERRLYAEGAAPLLPVHPGEIIREEFLKPLGLWAIIEGRAPILPANAEGLHTRFGGSVEFWLNLQARHDERTK